MQHTIPSNQPQVPGHPAHGCDVPVAAGGPAACGRGRAARPRCSHCGRAGQARVAHRHAALRYVTIREELTVGKDWCRGELFAAKWEPTVGSQLCDAGRFQYPAHIPDITDYLKYR